VEPWRTASTRISSTAARTLRNGGRLLSPPRRIPGGMLHAYRTGDDHTACGELLAPLKRWPAKRFGRGGLARQRCRACTAATRR
jgi:hypothetical protein